MFYIFLSLIPNILFAQTNYPDNEDGENEDLLTPEYYETSEGENFRIEVNRFVYYARQIPFQHPFKNLSGNSPAYTIGRSFGDGMGNDGTSSHHPALDYYLSSSDTIVNLYAACSGYVNVDTTVSRYRHYLSITHDVTDSSGIIIGKMVVLYGHIEINNDIAANIDMDGQYVEKGDLVSKNLYSGTKGGPHLHFEIRYYRSTDSGFEDFYGRQTIERTSVSTGSWSYGYWDPNAGYGFAHPLNHLNQTNTSTIEEYTYELNVFPNPVNDYLFIESDDYSSHKTLAIFNIHGAKLFRTSFKENTTIDFRNYTAGIYLVKLINADANYNRAIKILKE